ncbi:flagellar basal-body MS-ring/collar protein FliF [Salinisphaera sp. RV14]|uniref:flagellar basal-body MS-ring/collar protein FliF n=1 Tax=unclassified Salinisphaera TaxID=2649847 RepID=UPI003F8677B6
MAGFDWKAFVAAQRARVAEWPRWVWMVVAGSVAAALLLVVILGRGPSYSPLYDGLSASEGGQVIDKLQKLGIPYKLNSSGSIISVPAPDLARARLKLGQMGVPESQGSQAYQKLTKGSMTTSATAENALSRRAIENRLSQAIEGINGVSNARVTLALPKSTPFLKNQPHPKASVWIRVGAGGLSTNQAQAIGQMVANSVPGLDAKRVTVTDQNGNVLAPVSHSGLGEAQQQIQFTSQVEHRTERHIEALIQPLLGTQNMRVSAAASIDFTQATSRAEQYGPKSKVGQLKHETHNQVGDGNSQQGVPGALSNQPPGKAAAPLKTSQQNGGQGNGQGNGNGNGSNQGQGSSQAGSQTSQQKTAPHSSSNKWDVHYQVDHSTTVSHAPPWHLKGLSVSVVLNQHAMGSNKQLAAQIKQIVQSAIAAPNLKVNVAEVPFGIENAPTPATTSWRAYVSSSALMKSLMALLAALLILFGLAKPLARWIRESLPTPPRPAWTQRRTRSGVDDGDGEVVSPQVDHQRQVESAQELARTRPEETAELLRRWIRGEDSNGENNSGEEVNDGA